MKTPLPTPKPAALPWWPAPLLALLAFAVYSPALAGPFLFDDLALPFLNPNSLALPDLLARGLRALTNLSLHLDKALFGLNPAPFHLENLLLHCLNALLVFLLLRRALELFDRPSPLAALAGAALFLLHPLQTEAVSYVASRSELLCVLFSYSALLVFLRASSFISWPRAAAILLLAALGMLAKEPAVAVAGVFVAFDLLHGGPRRLLSNFRLYGPLLAGAAALSARFIAIASTEGTAGQGFSTVNYLFTQFQSVWIYLRLALLPFGQSIDHAFPYASPSAVLSWLGLAALLAAAGAALYFRKSYPLAALGLFSFLLFLAPTSSLIPIADPLVERRVYLAFFGLLLLAAEFLSRLSWSNTHKAAVAGLLLLFSAATYARNGVYQSPTAMWQDALRSNDANPRAHFQLAFAYYSDQRCAEALPHFARAAQLQKPDDRLLVDWAYALDCTGDSKQAIDKLKQALPITRDAATWTTLGMFQAKQNLLDEALASLNVALRMDPRSDMALAYRGNVHLLKHMQPEARADFDAALQLNPDNEVARQGRAALR